MENLSSTGPWEQIREDIKYEINPSGLIRTIPIKKNRVVYLKPSNDVGKKVRYQLHSDSTRNKSGRVDIPLHKLFRMVWGETPEITDENVRTLKQMAERKNRENCVNQKEKTRTDPEDEPVMVNGKPRYCIFCGYQLYKSDRNYFYHTACYRGRSEDMIEDCFAGCHSYE